MAVALRLPAQAPEVEAPVRHAASAREETRYRRIMRADVNSKAEAMRLKMQKMEAIIRRKE
jgi:hypothetical protein